MPRLLGIDIPGKKRVEYALRYIYGVGPARAKELVGKAKIDPMKKADDLTDEEMTALSSILQSSYRVEGDLLRARVMAGGDEQGAANHLREAHGPLKGLHPAQRPAGDAEQLLNAEMARISVDHLLLAVQPPGGGVEFMHIGSGADHRMDQA